MLLSFSRGVLQRGGFRTSKSSPWEREESNYKDFEMGRKSCSVKMEYCAVLFE